MNHLQKSILDLTLIIGKGSNNDLFEVDLMALPHLFVSYSEPGQINLFLKDAVETLTRQAGSGNLQFACALSKAMYSGVENYLRKVKLFSLFIRNEALESARGSKYLFMRTLMKELKRRQKIKLSPGKNSVSKLNPLVVIIDDIFDIIITKRKYTGSYFLELLTAGNELGIHFVVASIWAYRNLLSQLIKSKQDTKKAISNPVAEKNFLTIQPLIAELIITPEDLYFFKLSNQTDYTRYFPAREGLNKPFT